MKKDEGKSFTPYYIAIMVAGFAIYKIWQFANRPDALEQALEFLGGVAVCFGAVVLFMAAVLIATSVANAIEKEPFPRATDLQYEVNAARTKPSSASPGF